MKLKTEKDRCPRRRSIHVSIRIILHPNQRLIGKNNFLGVEAINPSFGLPCANMAFNVDSYMNYKIHGMCPEDGDIVQKLISNGCEISNGCDPLPRRRCFTRTSPHHGSPLSTNAQIVSNAQILQMLRMFQQKEILQMLRLFQPLKTRWDIPTNQSVSAEFTINEVLSLKPGEICIGLDISPTTGTFAAIMKEKNVTIASATLNLGASFNEVIALRCLMPLYISVSLRLPFFDNTFDIIHSTLFLDVWIDVEFLQFVLFDLDRVLLPKGLLWIDRFFCKKEDMKMYLDEFNRLGCRQLLWRIVPKMDKLGDELCFSAALEKPIRG